ncbi:DUF4189 domain-containing protein [Acidovorax sp. SUPP2539]|uniref:DUF4189 domain-containing protein n=1 Tax=Acidovorax sp. SUPP2539 TaxID=2920878 RepID=UPI0023DE1A35|nr:DUF4189 domain-containing protein [Acidovorax sp. SUPP2539]GKS92245.1 DUF4189 domain-containing protein [Acidovorax sp. SUPP2539]
MSYTKLLGFLAAWMMICCGAVAQTACLSGVAAGSARCSPSSDGGEEASPRPTGEWIKTWGVIATSPSGIGGVSSRQLSEDAARKMALENCRSAGMWDCKVEFVYQNQCVALVHPAQAIGAAFTTAATAEEAVRLGKARCAELVKGECKVAISECSEPVSRKF